MAIMPSRWPTGGGDDAFSFRKQFEKTAVLANREEGP
jgi:hypothetical protein